MKFNRIFLALATFAGVTFGAVKIEAQGLGFDLFAPVRTVIVAPPVNITFAVGGVTNSPVDIRNFDGISTIDFLVETNTGATGGTLTATVYTSNDTTNWVALSNYALINTTTPLVYTNYFYPPGLKATNTYLFPGTIVNPVAATAGWATSYIQPLPFTNSGAITISASGGYEIGFDVSDAQRYVAVAFNAGGTITNFTASALMKTIIK